MSEILVIVPAEWTPVEKDEMAGLIGWTIQTFSEVQGRPMIQLNEALLPTGWLPEGMRVLDVLVINDKLYFKYELNLD